MAQVCPKCQAENADNAYFCARCNTHIRSAFSASSPTLSVEPGKLSTVGGPVKSLFSSPVAVAEPEVAADTERNLSVADESIAEDGRQIDETQALPAVAVDTPPEEQGAQAKEDSDEPVQLAAVSEGVVIPLITDAFHPPLAATPPPVPREGFFAAGKTAPPPQSGKPLYEEVKLQDMFPLLRQMGSKLTTSATASSAIDPANTSGQRDKATLPVEARRWSWAGFVPGGAFGFALGMPALGILGLLGLFTGQFGLLLLWPLYILVVGIKGRELVWRNRRFESLAQYNEMTGAWDIIGRVCILIDIVIYSVMLAATS